MPNKKITPCPKCGYEIDDQSALADDNLIDPQENDLSLCFKCHEWLRFDKDLNLISLTADEIDDMEPELREQMTTETEKLIKYKSKLN